LANTRLLPNIYLSYDLVRHGYGPLLPIHDANAFQSIRRIVAHDWGRFFKWVEPGEFQRMGIPKDLQEFLEEN